MRQMTLAASGFEKHAKATRGAQFLAEMEHVVPWAALCALIEPVYSRGTSGRPPVGLERMLRIYFPQQWFNLSGPAVEEALYDSIPMGSFVDIDLGREPAPDETTICRSRHLLESHDLGKRLFEEVGHLIWRRRIGRSLAMRSSLAAKTYSSSSCARSFTFTPGRASRQGLASSDCSSRLGRPFGVPTRY